MLETVPSQEPLSPGALDVDMFEHEARMISSLSLGRTRAIAAKRGAASAVASVGEPRDDSEQIEMVRRVL